MKTRLLALLSSLTLGFALTLSAADKPAACPASAADKAACTAEQKAACPDAAAKACCAEKEAANCPAAAGCKMGGATASASAYPLTTCVVSGEKLGEMGDTITYIYKEAGKPDRTVLLCCKMCVKKFQKDPAKYLSLLDAAAAK